MLPLPSLSFFFSRVIKQKIRKASFMLFGNCNFCLCVFWNLQGEKVNVSVECKGFEDAPKILKTKWKVECFMDLFSPGKWFWFCERTKGWVILFRTWFSVLRASWLWTSWISAHNSSFLASAPILVFLVKSVSGEKGEKQVKGSLSEGQRCCFCRHSEEMKLEQFSSSQAAVLFLCIDF